MTLPLAALLLPLLMQVGPNPRAGAIPDYSGEMQDRPARIENAVTADDTPVWLSECFDLVESDPARAHARAQIQRETATGQDRILANHCLGLAATRLERWDEARTAFTAGRDEVPANDRRMRARLGAMAGNAALAQGDVGGALALLATAHEDAQASKADILQALIALDQARALVSQGQLEQAAAALEESRRLQPGNTESWLLSATLMRRMNRLEEAQVQIEQAAQLNPADPRIALEAGVIAVLDGRDDAARQSWDSVIALELDGNDADTARAYLQQLDDIPANQP